MTPCVQELEGEEHSFGVFGGREITVAAADDDAVRRAGVGRGFGAGVGDVRDRGVDDVVGLGGMDATPVGWVEIGWTSDFWRSRSWLLSIFFRSHN
jgi:hypothetical protein